MLFKGLFEQPHQIKCSIKFIHLFGLSGHQIGSLHTEHQGLTELLVWLFESLFFPPSQLEIPDDFERVVTPFHSNLLLIVEKHSLLKMVSTPP